MNILEKIVNTLRGVDEKAKRDRLRVKKIAMAEKDVGSSRKVIGQVEDMLKRAGIGGEMYYDESEIDEVIDEAKDIKEEQQQRKYKEAVTADRIKNIRDAIREGVKFRKQSKMLEEAVLFLETQKKTKTINDKLAEVKKILLDLENKFNNLHNENVDSHYIYHRFVLKELQNHSDKAIIAVPSVEEVMKRIHRMIASGETGLLGGPTGAGKTRMIETVAMEVMEKRIEKISKDKTKNQKEKDAEIATVRRNGHWRMVSGKKAITEAEVFGQEGVRVKPPDDYSTIQKKIDDDLEIFKQRYAREHRFRPRAPRKLVEIKRREREEYYAKQQTGGIETEFILGQIYEAMEAGIPFVLDEVNAIPAEVLIGLNEIMEKRPGQTVRVQGNGKNVKIKEGFCIISTGNFGAEYSGRFPIDVSFLNRIKHVINVDYLKNTTEVQDELGTPDVLGNELLMVLLSKWMGKSKEIKVGGLAFPDTLQSFANFAKFVRLVQDVSSGKKKDINLSEEGEEGAKVELPIWKYLKKPIGMREVLGIVEEYLDNLSDFKPLEYYIMKKLFDVPETEGGDKDKVIRAIHYTLLKQFGLFTRFAGYEDFEKENVKIVAMGHSVDFKMNIQAMESYFDGFKLKDNPNFPGKAKKLFGEELVSDLFGPGSKERDYEAIAKTIKLTPEEQIEYDNEQKELIKAQNLELTLQAQAELKDLQDKVKAEMQSA